MRIVKLALYFCCAVGAILIVNMFFANHDVKHDEARTEKLKQATIQNPVAFNNDVAELVERLQLPVQPINVWWHESISGNQDNPVPGPTDVSLLVYIELHNGDIDVLLDNRQVEAPALRLRGSDTSMPTIFQQLGKQYRVKQFDVNSFARQPYSFARLEYVVDTNFIIIVLGS